MPAAAVNRIERAREDADCGIVALSCYLGVSYEDVLRAVTVTARSQGRKGLWTRTMQRVAQQLGHDLRVRRRFAPTAYGILRLPEHTAVIRNGLVLDTDGRVWEVAAFLKDWHVELIDCELLVAVE